MKKSLRALATVPAALALAALTPSTAVAAPAAEWQAPEVAWVNTNVVTTDGGETATMLVKYRCWGIGVHLWGSVKQGPQIDPSLGFAGTGSNRAVAWRETPEGPAPTCTGQWVTERVTIEATPDTAGKDDLDAGSAWAQFVIFAIDPANPSGEPGRGSIGTPQTAFGQWVDVRGVTG